MNDICAVLAGVPVVIDGNDLLFWGGCWTGLWMLNEKTKVSTNRRA